MRRAPGAAPPMFTCCAWGAWASSAHAVAQLVNRRRMRAALGIRLLFTSRLALAYRACMRIQNSILLSLTWLGLLCATACQTEATRKRQEAQRRGEPTSAEDAGQNGAPARSSKDTKKGGGRRQGGGRGRISSVYLDGKPLAAIRYGELPKGLGVVWYSYGIRDTTGEFPRFRAFRLADYLELLGVDIAKLKGIFLTAGRTTRISYLAPKELLKYRKGMFFSFSGGTAGRAQMRYAKGVKTNDQIDKLLNVYLFRDVEAPTWDPARQLFEHQGKRMSKMPAVRQKFPARATRIYFNDRLLTHVQRRQLRTPGAADEEEPTDSHSMSVVDYLKKQELSVRAIRRVEVVANDQTVLELSQKKARQYRISVKPGSGGWATVRPGDHLAQAIRAYTRVRATPRPDYYHGEND
ncbi:MAG: hypothetical protein AAFU66_04695 [Pseudomonadota bacterium]